jgi:hypothetical protein
MIADDVKISCYKCIKFLLTENYNGMFSQLKMVILTTRKPPRMEWLSLYIIVLLKKFAFAGAGLFTDALSG